jgi:hypothetical protein
VANPRSVAFARQIEASAARFAGVTGGRLQNAQAELDAVVCSQAFRNQRRQQQICLSEPLDDF